MFQRNFQNSLRFGVVMSVHYSGNERPLYLWWTRFVVDEHYVWIGRDSVKFILQFHDQCFQIQKGAALSGARVF